jgi:hypothetical protein
MEGLGLGGASGGNGEQPFVFSSNDFAGAVFKLMQQSASHPQSVQIRWLAEVAVSEEPEEDGGLSFSSMIGTVAKRRRWALFTSYLSWLWA